MGKARVAFRVGDLTEALQFYVGVLGWEEADVPDAPYAMVRLPSGNLLLLAADPTLDLAPLMDPAGGIHERGKVAYIRGRDLRALHGRLPESTLRAEEPFGLTLSLADPDGNLLQLVEDFPMTDEEIRASFRKGPDLLQAALAGLSEQDLDLVRAPGKWSIRQIALHLVDSDMDYAYQAMFAMADPGKAFTANAFAQDTWAENLDYAHRPVSTAVQLFRLQREYVAELCAHLPTDGLGRAFKAGAAGVEVPARSLVRMLARHAFSHTEQIWETRRVHGR